MQGAVQDEHRHLSYNFLIIHFCAVVCFGTVTFCAQARVARGDPLLRLGRDQACMCLGGIAAGLGVQIEGLKCDVGLLQE